METKRQRLGQENLGIVIFSAAYYLYLDSYPFVSLGLPLVSFDIGQDFDLFLEGDLPDNCG